MKNRITYIVYIASSFIICLLFLFIDLAIFMYKPTSYVNDNHYVLEEEETIIPSDVIRRGDLERRISFSSNVIRENDEIDIITVPIENKIKCYIGAVVNSPSDISSNWTYPNFKSGRVLNIEKNNESHLISIDLSSNYFCYVTVSSSYNRYINTFLSDPQILSTYNKVDRKKLDLLYLNYSFNKNRDAYILKYQLNSMSTNIYSSVETSTRYVLKRYDNVYHISFRCLKSIDEYNIGVLEHIVDAKKNILEEVRFEVKGFVDSYIVIDGASYDGEKFKRQNFALTNYLFEQFY